MCFYDDQSRCYRMLRWWQEAMVVLQDTARRPDLHVRMSDLHRNTTVSRAPDSLTDWHFIVFTVRHTDGAAAYCFTMGLVPHLADLPSAALDRLWDHSQTKVISDFSLSVSLSVYQLTKRSDLSRPTNLNFSPAFSKLRDTKGDMAIYCFW